MNKKGFTLIELLVVIAIIGILASIVLVSLGSARNKAKDARIIAELSQVRSIAEMIADDATTGYADLCFGDTLCDTNSTNCSDNNYTAQLKTIEDDMLLQMPTGNTVACFADADEYCVSATLNIGGGYCVDSTGWAGSSATAVCAAVGACTH